MIGLKTNKSFWLIAPYAVWMALMTVLPATAAGYAVRTGVTALVLVEAWWALRTGETSVPWRGGWWRPLAWGVAVGLAVFAMWTYPERFEIYRKFCILGDVSVAEGSPFDPKACGWPLTIVRLAGSAFVIAAAEELFFRKWLIGFAGFWWMVGLFAIEHDRWLVGALCGAIYGALYLRKGLGAAIAAHVTTNLTLGVWVIWKGAWELW